MTFAIKDRCSTRLAELVPRRPNRYLAMIAALQPDIEAAQQRGCTLADIAQALGEEGFPISAASLRNGLAYVRKKARMARLATGQRDRPAGVVPRYAEPARGSFVPPREIPLQDL